jgi:hypothetical protein
VSLVAHHSPTSAITAPQVNDEDMIDDTTTSQDQAATVTIQSESHSEMDDVVASGDNTIDVRPATQNQGEGFPALLVNSPSTSNDFDMGGTDTSSEVDDHVEAEMDGANVKPQAVACPGPEPVQICDLDR